MDITVIGTGFVGVVSASVYASLGHSVYGLDVSEEKIKKLEQGKVPFFEPGLDALVQKMIAAKSLQFTTSYKHAIQHASVIVIAVGTPSAPDGQADLSYVMQSAESLAPFLKENAIVAVKSTVPPGTCQKVRQVIQQHCPHSQYFVVSLPEFLREGSAVEDTLHPDRVVIGATEDFAIDVLKKLHTPLSDTILVMTPESAQMAKYSANAYLATRITFINQIANLCEANGANILEVIQAIGQDRRIGTHYWYPGLGYGGSCFPKDVKELAAYARSVSMEDNLMVTISRLNEERIPKIVARLRKQLGGFEGKTIGILGLSFKPNTDDIREAPSTKIIPFFLHEGAKVLGHDPLAKEVARSYFRDTILVEDDKASVLANADCVCVLVEWDEYSTMNPQEIVKLMKKGAVLFDARDQWKKTDFTGLPIQYVGIGV